MNSEGLSRFLGKVRPQIFLALTILGIIAYVGIMNDLSEVSIGCMAGIIALAKDVLQSDA